MLSSKTVVLDLEGFRHRKEKFIVKEFGICTERLQRLCFVFTTIKIFRFDKSAENFNQLVI